MIKEVALQMGTERGLAEGEICASLQQAQQNPSLCQCGTTNPRTKCLTPLAHLVHEKYISAEFVGLFVLATQFMVFSQ